MDVRGRGELEEWAWRFCCRMWKGEGWPEGWKERVMIPVIKKGEETMVEKYKEIIFMLTIYKICAMVLA